MMYNTCMTILTFMTFVTHDFYDFMIFMTFNSAVHSVTLQVLLFKKILNKKQNKQIQNRFFLSSEAYI
jgi:hypothetical protein